MGAMDARAIFDRTAALVGDAVFDFRDAATSDEKEGPRDPFFRAAPARLVDVMARLRDDSALSFDFLQNLTAIDWLERDVMEVVYHLFSYRHRHATCVKVDLPRAAPSLPSVALIWPTANWLEREQYDLLGVTFDGHPDLRRLLMPDDWVGHPMRKDFREPKSYRGMPTSRPSPMDLLATYDKAHTPRATVATSARDAGTPPPVSPPPPPTSSEKGDR